MPRRLMAAVHRVSMRNLSREAFLKHADITNAGFLASREMPGVCPPVRGFTSSLEHRDIHCCVGRFLDYKYTVLHRELDNYVFVVVGVKLDIKEPLPRCYILHNSTPHDIFERIISLNPHHHHAPFTIKDGFAPRFIRRASVFAKPVDFSKLQNLLNGKIADIIKLPDPFYLHEIDQQHLYIYRYSRKAPKDSVIDAQVGYACLLAKELSNKANQ